MTNWYRRIGSAGQWGISVLWTLCLLALPLVVRADDDEKPVPLDPQTKAAQNWVFGIIALIVVLALGWYWWRRRQIIRSGRSVDGDTRWQD